MRGKLAALSLVSLVTVSVMPFLHGYEDTKLKSYPDSGGIYTICSGVTFIPEVGAVTPGMELSRAQCDDLDRAVASGFVMEVARLIKVPISVESMTAHATFAYNVGIPGYKKSFALKYTNQGRYEDGCKAMANWYRAGGKDCRIRSNNCAGLITRRSSEVRQCLSGV